MPRGFSEKEKIVIRQRLLEEGKIFFGSYGLKKTSIADLTKSVGIAQGSFYIFFNSKEELYYEILENEEKQLKERLFNELAPLLNRPREYLRNLLLRSIDIVHSYPLMAQLYLENTMEILLRKLPEEKLEKHFKDDHTGLLPYLEKWRSQGLLKDEDPEIITSLIRSVLLLSLHKKEIGEKMYDGTMRLLIDLLTEGLIPEVIQDE